MATDARITEMLGQLAHEDAPVLKSIAMMHLDTLENSGLDERTYHLVRLAALVALDASPVSYLAHLTAADAAGVTLEDAQGTLVAILPVVGTARVTSAAGKVLRGLGLGEALAE